MNDGERQQFIKDWQTCGGDVEQAGAAFERVIEMYASPGRKYHNVDHVRFVLEQLELGYAAGGEFDETQRACGRLAVWYHDAIYDPRGPENEERSAALAFDDLSKAGADEAAAELVRDGVLATTHSLVEPGDELVALVCDADLAVLGETVDHFAEYEWNVRQEYAFVPDVEFAAARAELLGWFAERDRIYWTEYFYEKYEEAARGNLRRAVKRWVGQ